VKFYIIIGLKINSKFTLNFGYHLGDKGGALFDQRKKDSEFKRIAVDPVTVGEPND